MCHFSAFTLSSAPVESPSLCHSLVSLDQCQALGTCLVVTVLDHDTLRTDDFEGEAFLALKAIPGVAGGREGGELSKQPDAIPAQIRLPLMHPKPNGMWAQWASGRVSALG